MTRKMIIALATVVLAICLVSGGCKSVSPNSSEIKSWKEMLKLAPRLDSDQPSTGKNKPAVTAPGGAGLSPAEGREITLYFAASDGQGLVRETRRIEKTEGIARRTLQELIKGPVGAGGRKVFPEGAQLLDINIKPEGLCIVDFSRETSNIESGQAEKMLVYSVVSTLSQFPTVKEVSFRINGEDVATLNGAVDLSQPIIATKAVTVNQ